MYVDEATAGKWFASTVEKTIVGKQTAPVPAPEHLLAMKAIAMKNASERVLIDAPDVQFLLKLPGVDRSAARDFFATWIVGVVRCNRTKRLTSMAFSTE